MKGIRRQEESESRGEDYHYAKSTTEELIARLPKYGKKAGKKRNRRLTLVIKLWAVDGRSNYTPRGRKKSSRVQQKSYQQGVASGAAVKPEDALLTQYDTLVRGAYIRHVVLETEELSDLAMKTYLRGDLGSYDDMTDKLDPFGKLARDISACAKSREEAGKVGWVDNPFHPDFISRGERNNEVVSDMISNKVIEELFLKKPKGGDVIKLESISTSDDTQKNNQWHLCRVDDLMIDYVNSEKDAATTKMEEETMAFKQRGVNKIITNRSKLKGLGTTPIAPNFLVQDSDSADDKVSMDNVAKTYHIATSGCQMNVADSERLAGVLENNLKLSPAQNPQKADVVILNTCSIRDHAEQKVYDALGPHAARKRRGESLALVVAGCVAQQEGEALLKRVPGEYVIAKDVT